MQLCAPFLVAPEPLTPFDFLSPAWGPEEGAWCPACCFLPPATASSSSRAKQQQVQAAAGSSSSKTSNRVGNGPPGEDGAQREHITHTVPCLSQLRCRTACEAELGECTSRTMLHHQARLHGHECGHGPTFTLKPPPESAASASVAVGPLCTECNQVMPWRV